VTILLTDAEVRELVDYKTLTEALRKAFQEQALGNVVVAPRLNLSWESSFLRLMGAIYPSAGVCGYKAFQGTDARGVRYVIGLARLDDGELLAYMDARYLTAARTGATSAVAAAVLHAEPASNIAVLGSGLEAETNLRAVFGIHPVGHVSVFSPNAVRRTAFAEKMTETLNAQVVPVDDAAAAAREADIVIVATNTGKARAIAYEGSWMRRGQLVISIGATNPMLRELDEAAYVQADRIVLDADQSQVCEECGDLREASAATRQAVMGATALDSVVRDGFSAAADGSTLFKSVGAPLQDVVAANVVYQAALEKGIGTDIGQIAEPKSFPNAGVPD
jgi:alanine dehydrogenase